MRVPAYRIKEDSPSWGGRIIVENGNDTILLASFTEPTQFVSKYVLNQYQTKGLAYEVDLLKQSWIHPHLHKPIKKIVNEELGTSIP